MTGDLVTSWHLEREATEQRCSGLPSTVDNLKSGENVEKQHLQRGLVMREGGELGKNALTLEVRFYTMDQKHDDEEESERKRSF